MKQENLEKIHNKLERIEEVGKLIWGYLFIYGFSIGFLLIGITIILTPANPDLPKFALIVIGGAFLIGGMAFLFLAVKETLRELILSGEENENIKRTNK